MIVTTVYMARLSVHVSNEYNALQQSPQQQGDEQSSDFSLTLQVHPWGKIKMQAGHGGTL